MLTYLSIDNLALIHQAKLHLQPGFTVVTGPTGSGKSMLFHAISLILGHAANAQSITVGQKETTIEAHFTIKHNDPAQAWLEAHGFAHNHTLMIQRTLKHKGRGKQSINDQPIALAALQALGQHLISIQKQHDHLHISQPPHIAHALDILADGHDLAQQTTAAYDTWLQYHKAEQKRHTPAEQQARSDLIHHYLAELKALNPQHNEWDDLCLKQEKMRKHHDIDQALSALMTTLTNEPTNVLATLFHHSKALRALPLDKPLMDLTQTLEEGHALLQETHRDLSHYLNDAHHDTSDLEQLEKRLADFHALARKHHTQPNKLPTLITALETELAEIEHALSDQAQLQAHYLKAQETWQNLATALAKKRQSAMAPFLTTLRTGMQALGMPYAQCHLECKTNPSAQPQPHGLEQYHLWVSTNPDQPMQPVKKVASGGEQSRIALVLQQLLQHHSANTLIFDEADTGISGDIAHQVGKQLRRLAATRQILCITHLPQVAAQGEHHIAIEKKVCQDKTQVTCQTLKDHQREQAIARMMANQAVTQSALDQARTLLSEQD